MTVANTILQQLGGNRFAMMTGAKLFVGTENGLRFKLPGNGFAKDGINCVQITLAPSDTYDVTFMAIRKNTVTVKATFSDIYNDQLRAIFTKATGLETSLGTMGVAR